MALDQLALYNAALQLIGERRINTLTDAVESRYELDAIWNINPAYYCAELVAPRFATKTIKLDAPVLNTEHGLSNTFTLPVTFIEMVELYSDAELDQPISRYIREGDTLSCDYDVIYLRYIEANNIDDYSLWSNSFTRVVSAYLATELAERINSDRKESMYEQFQQRVAQARELDAGKEPMQRAKGSELTLTPSWLRIYNDALLILGEPQLTSLTDDSDRKSVLDVAVNADLVATVLEDIGWHWAIVSEKLTFDPSLEPEWGYRYAYRLPDNLHRFDGIWADEFFSSPIKHYQDEAGILYCEYTEIFIKYVNAEYLTTPDDWKPSFRRYVASILAMNVCARFGGADKNYVIEVHRKRKSETMAIDAQQSPPHLLTKGNWVQARQFGRSGRRRP